MRTFLKSIIGFFQARKPRAFKPRQPDYLPINLIHQAPFFRILIPFLFGILSEDIWLPWIGIDWMLIGFLWVFLIWILFTIIKPIRLFLPLTFNTLLLYISLYIMGAVWPQLHSEIHNQQHFSKYLSNATALEITLTDELIAREHTYRTKGTVQKIYTSTEEISCQGNILLYIDQTNDANQIKPGHTIIVLQKPTLIPKPLNPHEFDYARYMKFNGFEYQLYIHNQQYKTLSLQYTNVLNKLYHQSKNYIKKIYRLYIPESEQRSVASALIFGFREDLSEDIIQAYSKSGTLHVLAVSGLHVGIVLMVLKWIFRFLERDKKKRLLRCAFILILLWFYVLLTGFTNSVCRAAIMFSFVLIAESFQRKSNIYNSIFMSALILLFYNPYTFYDIGFQLSYAAVLGIVFLQPYFQKIWEPQNWILHQLWILVSVSVVAQLATFPVSFYYFGQFPNYFLVSNIVIIPLTTFITYLGLILIVLSPFTLIAEYPGKLLNELIRFTDDIVFNVCQWPFATTENINISIIETIFIYSIIVFICLYFIQKKIYFLNIGFLCSVLLVICFIADDYYIHHQNKLIVHAINNKTMITFMNGTNADIIGDSVDLASKKILQYKINGLLKKSGIQQINKINMTDTLLKTSNGNIIKNKNMIVLSDAKLFIWDKPCQLIKPLEVDYVILRKNSVKHLKELCVSIKSKLYIADLSNSQYNIAEWRKQAKQYHIPFQDCLNGAVVINN